MMLLVDCTNCRRPLQLPPGAHSIRCAICQAVSRIAEPPHHGAPHAASSHQFYHPPSPYNHAPPGQPPSVHGRKRALICGISYRYSRYELKGCINDAKCMKYLLMHRFNFPESSILMLTEEETDPYRLPTKHNIRMAMHWLVQGCQPGDSLVFHYSGHGSQHRNYTGDEITGYDETLCPLDFETQGMIIDSEINAAIVRPLPRGVKLHAIVDACHSGTVVDLAYLCRMDRSGRYVWEDHRPRTGVWKGTSGGEVISFSGCDDDQTSADTSALSHVTSTGAMTFSFIQAIEQGQATTYGNMLTHIRSIIRNADTNVGPVGGGVVTSLLTMLLTGGSLGTGMRQHDWRGNLWRFVLAHMSTHKAAIRCFSTCRYQYGKTLVPRKGIVLDNPCAIAIELDHFCQWRFNLIINNVLEGGFLLISYSMEKKIDVSKAIAVPAALS